MIGLDIGSKYIKACTLSLREGEAPVVNYAIKELASRTPEQVSRTVKALTDKLAAAAGKEEINVAAGIGSQEVLFRSIEFPEMPDEELRSSLKLQAEKYIYSDISDMEIDFNTLEKIEESNKLKILIAAAPKKEIAEKVDAIQEAGLYALVMDVDTLAMINAFTALRPSTLEESAIFVCCGEKYTNFAIMNKGKYCFAKNMNYGGGRLTAAVAEELGIAPSKAEEIKRDPQLWESAGLNISSVLRKSTPDLLETLHRSVEFCRGQRLISNIDNIYFTGGATLLPGFVEFIAEILGGDVHLWNPLAEINGAGAPAEGFFLPVALGLALRR